MSKRLFLNASIANEPNNLSMKPVMRSVLSCELMLRELFFSARLRFWRRFLFASKSDAFFGIQLWLLGRLALESRRVVGSEFQCLQNVFSR